MAYVLVQIKFEDFTKWQEVFSEAIELRKSYGSKGVRVFCPVDRHNEATILVNMKTWKEPASFSNRRNFAKPRNERAYQPHQR